MSIISKQKTGRAPMRVSKPVIGLDIGSQVAKAALCRRQSSGWDVLSVDSMRLAPGDTADPESLCHRMIPWLKRLASDDSSNYVASIPSSFVDYETLDLAEPSDYEQTATMAMHDLLGEDLNDVAYDFWMNEEGSTAKIHLAWTMANFATSITNQIAKRGLQCGGLDAPVVALARVNSKLAAANARLVVDIGSGEATFVFSRSNQAYYFRNRIRFAAESAAETIAQRQTISRASAETLLSMHGIADPQENPFASLFYRTLEDWLQNLEFEIQRTSRFVQARWGDDAIQEIVLCGGGACIQGLAQRVANQLGIPTNRAGVPAGWRWLAAQAYSPLFAQALSLAEYGDYQ